MTPVTAVGTDADRIAGRVLQTSSGVIAGIVIATSIVSIVEIDGAMVIINTTDGVAEDRHS